ncbi:hypothetical protein MH117_05670 [Paenibacillus sp. ACRRX]|nr:hypothetical protein [Paenibacillus sp. ACRRX]MCG7406901.1 hypothetical protein [Paenibacillus sp. ACRRX]MDK8179834.1 hypothetical protein [Paenibacillus sp. UMB4589-SE434]
MTGRRILAGMSIASLCWLSGCGMPAAPEDLINPPSGNVIFPHASFRELLPEGSKVVNSAHGTGSSGISYGDVDGDGVDEAVVVYEESTRNEKLIKAALFKQHGNKWRIIWDTAGSGYGLDYAAIRDADQDGTSDIMLGWSLGREEKGLDIYVWRDNDIKLWKQKGYRGPSDLDQGE